MSHLDIKYATMLQYRLEKFNIVSRSPLTINFRCPFCGDSQTNKSIARGFILTRPRTDEHYYYCHNCSISKRNFGQFLKDIDHLMWKDYLAETFLDGRKPLSMRVRVPKKMEEPKEIETEEEKIEDQMEGLRPILDLDEYHPARAYVIRRKLPKEALEGLFYVDQFKAWINTRIPDKFGPNQPDEGRIVIPFFSKEGKLVGVNGRAVGDNKLRYIAIMFDEDHPKVYGLDKIKNDETMFILEGAFDSMFVKNSIAMAGLGSGDHFSHPDRIFVIDNEPRNYEVVKRISKLLDQNERVVIWPKKIKSKDLNEMVIRGEIPDNDIENFLRKNSYKGMTGRTFFNMWKRR